MHEIYQDIKDKWKLENRNKNYMEKYHFLKLGRNGRARPRTWKGGLDILTFRRPKGLGLFWLKIIRRVR